MNETQKYFLYIIKCFYLNTEPCEPSSEVDIEEFCKIAKNHDLEGIVFLKIQKLSAFKNTSHYNDLRLKFFSLTKHNILMEQNLEYLIDIFAKNEIPHILFKGAVIRESYTSKELRTMGDFDVLVEKDKIEKVNSVLIENGFEFLEKDSEFYTKDFKYNGTLFEIHLNIANKNCNVHSGDFVSFFEDAFSHKEKLREFTYTLEPTYHLLFMLYHIEKHFEHNGCGIRMFLDFPLFIDNNNIDFRLLNKYLTELNLQDFGNSVFFICNKIFGSNIPIEGDVNIDEDLLNYIILKIVKVGTFGFVGRTNAQKLNMIKVKNNYDYSKKSHRIKGFLRWVFPSREYMFSVNMWDMDRPVILLPIYYVKRFIRTYKKRGVRNWYNETKNTTLDDKDVAVIKKMGIDK